VVPLLERLDREGITRRLADDRKTMHEPGVPGAERRTMSTPDDWTDTLCAELGLDLEDASQKTVLNLARVVAHTVDRPAAPLTAYFLGVAVGRGAPLAETAAKLQQLARGWPANR
jgi:Domain of unknown function (DUF6457)/Elongation factor SelB, winged helix